MSGASGLTDGRTAWKRSWVELHPFDQGKVEEAARMGTAVEDPRLAPFVIGLVRRQRRQYQLGLAVGGGVLLVASLVATAASGAGWAELADGCFRSSYLILG